MKILYFAWLRQKTGIDSEDIVVPEAQELEVRTDFDGAIPKIDDMPWPGFPPDLISIALVVATQARGSVLIHQKIKKVVTLDYYDL